MNDDAELLRRYVEDAANEAFAELVQRHVNLVYSAALRQLNGDAHLAADAAQIVFTDLARKAGSLVGHRVLAGWLFTSTRYATAKLVRGERRRQAREGEAQLMQELNQDDAHAQLDWQNVRPVLDEVMGELGDHDREVILLRFFEGRDYASVGAKLNLSDNTARMRVERALDKLRALLGRRGVKSTSAALAVALANQAVVAAPTGLAAIVTGTALAGGSAIAAAAGGSAAAGAAATFMSMTKLQIGLAGAFAVAGATGLVVQAEANAQLRDDLAELRRTVEPMSALQAENQRLAKIAVEISDLRGDDARLVRLGDQASALKKQMQANAAAAALRPANPASSMSSRPRAALNGPVFAVTNVDQTPKVKFQARPSYPVELQRTGTGGEVVVDFVVDDKGDVQNAFALRSSLREFESSAVEAVSKWKFQAGQKGGSAVNTHMQVPIVFAVDPASRVGLLSWPTKESDTSATPPWF